MVLYGLQLWRSHKIYRKAFKKDNGDIIVINDNNNNKVVSN